MARPKRKDIDDNEVVQLGDAHGVRKAAAMLGLPYSTVYYRYHQAKAAGITGEPVATAEQEIQPPEGWEEEFWEHITSWESWQRRGSTEHHRADITISTDKPIGICFTSDWHIGNAGTHHALLKSLIDGILATPAMFVCCNGDLVDNFVALSHETGRYEQLLRPRYQKQLGAWLMERLAPRLLALTGGQHEHFETRVSDFDSAEYFGRKGRAVYLGPGGLVHLDVGGAPYVILMWHRYRGNSIYDATASAKRLFREHGPADIVVTSDKHIPAISYMFEQERFAVFVQSGTCKLEDQYAKSLGYQPLNPAARIASPVCILWPDRRPPWVTLDFWLGCEYLAFLRREATCANSN